MVIEPLIDAFVQISTLAFAIGFELVLVSRASGTIHQTLGSVTAEVCCLTVLEDGRLKLRCHRTYLLHLV